MKTRIQSAFFLLFLVAAACSKDAPAPGTGPKPPEVIPPPLTPLGRDGLPQNWVDAPFSQRSLYLEAEAPGPCLPCPPDSQCSPCPPPFHRFSTHPAGHPDGKMVFVAFTKPATGLKVGGYYHLSGRTVAWAPHGDIFITMDHQAREWFPPEKCKKLIAEYKNIRDPSKGACEKDDECTILPGGVDDCGRAMDKKTATLLEPIYQMFRDMCGLSIHCAPRFATPACRDGRCVEIRGK
ncbi:MAG: hypothetical protein CVU65_09755 [Deltaproteobacteria bacterium HGW-Deltaproteobacteria-22]|jgi:hypothetical protein|nr:MAG: hypothetical protein CVU65_09755 [Deltaproteobacteria bacterium HGW-Deltaproteobacteria-22]